MKKLTRSKTDNKIFGICGGIAKYFSVDSTVIRVLTIIASVMSMGTGAFVYLILFFVIPMEDDDTVIY